MKHIYTSLIAASLIGCASNPSIQNLDPPTFMQRELVIQAAQQCEDADMRPRVVYAYTQVQNHRVPVPIDVQCEPSAWRKVR